MTNKTNTVLYTGVSNNLKRRVYEHRSGKVEGFTSKYKINKLVYFESTGKVESAIVREKQIKSGSRKKKLEMIVNLNPEWRDLYFDI